LISSTFVSCNEKASIKAACFVGNTYIPTCRELVRLAHSLIQCLSTDLLLFPKDYDKVQDAPLAAAPELHRPNRTDQADDQDLIRPESRAAGLKYMTAATNDPDYNQAPHITKT
jgi:hypothetical protein